MTRGPGARDRAKALAGRLRSRRADDRAALEATLERERREAHDREERLRMRIAQQWAEGRAARERTEPVIEGGPSTYKPVRVPYGVDLAAAWAWRFVIIVIAGLMILYALRFFGVVVFPVLIALFLSALATPVVSWLERIGVRRKLGALLVVVFGLAFIGLLLTFVGQQVSSGINDLSGQVVDGLEEIRHWLRTGPLHASDSQINSVISNAQHFVTDQGKDWASRATEIGSAAAFEDVDLGVLRGNLADLDHFAGSIWGEAAGAPAGERAGSGAGSARWASGCPSATCSRSSTWRARS